MNDRDRHIWPGEAYVVYSDGVVRPLNDADRSEDAPVSLEVAPPVPEAFLTETVEATRLGGRRRV